MLTIDELQDSKIQVKTSMPEDFEKKKTPKREQAVSRYAEAKDEEESKMSLLTISNRMSTMEKASLFDLDRSGKRQISGSEPQKMKNGEKHEVLDFSSIQKFESSDSTLRKDSMTPELNLDIPEFKDNEVSNIYILNHIYSHLMNG